MAESERTKRPVDKLVPAGFGSAADAGTLSIAWVIEELR